MSGNPSVEYIIDYEWSLAYIYNVKFPDQKIRATFEFFEDIGINNVDDMKKFLYEKYKEKYMQ